jgi:type I restriction enzyme S subunit
MEVREPSAKYLARLAYKQTEVGLIPEDWNAEKLGVHATFRTGPFGSALHQSDYVYGGIPVINPMQIADGRIVPTPSMAISEEAARKLSDFRVAENEVLIGRRGEMGRCAVVLPEQRGWLCGTGSMIIRSKASLDARFAQRILSSPPVIAEIESTSVGTTMINLNQGTLRNLLIPLPPSLAEQQAIAEALSDADALIESLEQLLAKKRQIKQGAMQELLTGQKRLPGFAGKWEVKRLGGSAVLKARIGWQGLTTAEYKETGDFYLVTGTEFNNGYIDWSNCFFVDESRYKQDRYIQLRLHDVLVTKDGTIGKVALVDHLPLPATLNSGVFVIRPIEDAFHPEFFYYLLCSELFANFLAQLSAGSTINHLYQKDFVGFVFRVPPSIAEQTAIATVLSDMDAELAALEAKLAKARDLKQGMMQELLTGRIRLV